jgi:RNA polymerase sigma factor (sigma-70 family)
MATPETLAPVGLPETDNRSLISADVDPLEIAAQALLKLKAAGHSGILLRNEDFETFDTAGVTNLNDYREARQEYIIEPGYQSQFTSQQMDMFNKNSNLPEMVAKKIVRNWYQKPEEYEEAVAAGSLGLVKGILSFDITKVSEKATKGGTGYLYECVHGAILRSWRDRTYTRGKNEQGDSVKVPKPSVMMGTAESLDRPLSDDPESGTVIDLLILADSISEESIVNDQSTNDLISDMARVVNTYPEREREIFVRRASLGQTQAEIGRVLGISQVHVSRLLKRMGNDILAKLDLADQYEVRVGHKMRSPTIEAE